jgi:glycosyltransferase involved in cell wall biosynthesis
MGARVLILHYTPPGVIGGVERVIHQHGELLTDRGYEVSIVAGRTVPGRAVEVISEIDAARATSEAIEAELSARVVSPRFHAARRLILERLRPLFSAADFVIVHNAFTLHFSLPLTAALWELAGARREGSTIAWCHDLAWVNPLYTPCMYPEYPWSLLRFPAPGVRYVTVSHERKRELSGLWNKPHASIAVIPNGVDVASFLHLSASTIHIVERYGLLDRDAVLLLPVRITRRKNVEAGMRAVRSLADRGLDVRLVVTGPAAPHHPGRSRSYLGELKKLRGELNLEKAVIFLADEMGKNPDDETIAELYRVSDVLLMPSVSEGFGLPIVEAGLARLPAVVSDIPVFREVGGKDVWTFSLEERADRIAGQIVRALKNPSSRLYRRVLRGYRWDAIVERQIIPLLEASVIDKEDRGHVPSSRAG